MKMYLLIAGHKWYPGAGIDDWIRCYETSQKAQDQISGTQWGGWYINGNGTKYDWYEIVNLNDWINK